MRKCPHCNEVVEGRSDKMFCSPYCKSAYHYEKDRNKPPTRFQMVEKQLKQNRKLLAQYNKAGKATVRKSVLVNEGFNPDYYTNIWSNRQGDTYFFCYEFGFLERQENGKSKYIMVHWQSYMEKH